MYVKERLLEGGVTRKESYFISRMLPLIQSYAVSKGKRVTLQVHKSIKPKFITRFLRGDCYTVEFKSPYDLDYDRDHYDLTIGDDKAEADWTVLPKFNCTHKFENNKSFAFSTSTKICPICGRIISGDEISLLKQYKF